MFNPVGELTIILVLLGIVASLLLLVILVARSLMGDGKSES